jgi:hypothetical protein
MEGVYRLAKEMKKLLGFMAGLDQGLMNPRFTAEKYAIVHRVNTTTMVCALPVQQGPLVLLQGPIHAVYVQQVHPVVQALCHALLAWLDHSVEFLLARAHCVMLVNTAAPLLHTAQNVMLEHTVVAQGVVHVLCVVPGKQVGILPLFVFHVVLENTPLNRDLECV